jgi:predicted nucleic acid-binding protein
VSDLIFDTTLCIDLLHGKPDALAFAMERRARGTPLFHLVVVAEMIEGLKPREYRSLDAQLASGMIVVPTEHDLLTSLKLLRRHRPSHGVGWPDCVIAATALRLGVAVATRNHKHFRMIPRLEVIPF